MIKDGFASHMYTDTSQKHQSSWYNDSISKIVTSSFTIDVGTLLVPDPITILEHSNMPRSFSIPIIQRCSNYNCFSIVKHCNTVSKPVTSSFAVDVATQLIPVPLQYSKTRTLPAPYSYLFSPFNGAPTTIAIPSSEIDTLLPNQVVGPSNRMSSLNWIHDPLLFSWLEHIKK